VPPAAQADIIAELRAVRTALAASERRFRALFEQPRVGVAIIDSTTGRFLRVNRKYEEIIGYSAAELQARDFMAITYPEDLADDLAAMERLRRGEIREFYLEKRLLHADGTTIWIALSVTAMWSPGEPPTEHVAVVQDISERKAAEQRSAAARAELESTLAALPDLLFDVDDEGRIYDFRAPHPELLAAPPEVFLGRTMREVIPADAADVVERTLLVAARDGRAEGSRYELELAGGHRWFEMSAARKQREGGRTRLVAIVRDITEREVAEEHRRSLEAQLRQAQKMEALGTLAGGIAHDVNNLLTVIGLNVELLRRAVGGQPRAVEPLRDLRTVLGRATKLVQRILAFARKQPASRAVIAANDALAEATNLLRAMLPAGIALELVRADDALRVHADPTQLQQVLINLGTNAWQAIEGGTGAIGFEVARVTIAAGDPRLPAGAYARFRVRDDGAGMSEAVRERIFEPFFTTKGVGQGSGLGLAVAHGIVVEHGGVIEVDSAPGRGTTVDVFLPVALAEPAAAEPAAPTDGGGGKVVAYVDDESMLVDLVVKSLEALGHQGRGFVRPADALAALTAEPGAIDALITDLSMPEMSGIALARAARALRPDLPIALVSGYAPQDEDELGGAGIRHRLHKPFGLEQLDELLRAIFAASS
jgi:PAS domain S-box-containing protein